MKHSKLVVLVLIPLLALTLFACSSGNGTEVRPFSEVQESEFVFEADPTARNRAIFRMTTTEPMICAIVWGETEEFGNFNNSLAMNGTGIIEHDVFLPGAEPGVTYFFKVQGSTADGTLYESEVGTFTIPETSGEDTSSDIDVGPNLALEANVLEVSSEFSESFGASYAIDGDTNTEWATSGNGDEAFITIDLGETIRIGGVEFVTRSMADGTAIAEEFTVTVDGETFGPFRAANLAQSSVAEIDTVGQVIRFDLTTTTGGNTGAVEVRVYGPPPGG